MFGPPSEKTKATKTASMGSQQQYSRVPQRRATSDSLDPFQDDERHHGKRVSAREKRLTLAAGSGDLSPMANFSSSRLPPLRTPLERKDHIVKCPQPTNAKASVRRKPIKRTSPSSSHRSGKTTSPGVEAAKRKARQIRRLRTFYFILSVTVAIIFGVVGFFAFQYGSEYILKRDELIRQAVRDDELGPLLSYYQHQVNRLMAEKEHLHELLKRANLIEVSEPARQVTKLDFPSNPSETDDSPNPIRQMEHQMALHRVHGDQYTQGIQRMSRQLLVEKFGAGPYHVELQLAFPGDATAFTLKGSRTETILLELATAEEMPHTVYTFLSRVYQGLYDGCSFYHNAGHVLVAGALANVHTDANVDLKQRFVDAGLEQVHLQEYSTGWSHTEWTVGLAGRPGGTEFYVNTRNNAVDHGPGGQVGYQDPLDADPCFAKVVQGFELLERMQSTPDLRSVAARIAIVSARIVR